MARSVLITGARAAAALDLARDFSAEGWQVHLADSVISRMARWSSIAACHHRYPAPRQQGAAFRSWVLEFVQTHEVDLIVPVCEEVFHLATPDMHARLGSRLFAPASATLVTLHDKLEFARAAQGWSLPVPESHPLDHGRSWEQFAAQSARWVFKPRFSRFGGETLIGPDRDKLTALAASDITGWMAQRRITGDEACFHAIAQQGRILAFATYRSHWRLAGGASYAFDPLPPERHEALRSLAQTLARKAALHGQFGCDAIFDRDGNPQIIECNPRATSGVHLLAGSGALARSIGEGAVMERQAAQPAYLGPAMITFGLREALTSGRLKDWRVCLSAGRDAISRPHDRLPAIGAMVDSALFALAGMRRGISTTAATTRDIEWNGEEFLS